MDPPVAKCPMLLSLSYPIITQRLVPISSPNKVVTVGTSAVHVILIVKQDADVAKVGSHRDIPVEMSLFVK